MSGFTTDRLCELMRIRFSERQLAAITAPMAPSVIMAGAGSGKTSVMTARIVWLVATGAVQAHQVLGLTFTNKAAGEFRSRVREALAHPELAVDAADTSTIATYHSFAQQLIIDHGIRIGIEPEVRLLSDVRREQLAMRVVRNPDTDIIALSQATTSVVKLLLSLDDRLAEEAVEPADLRAFDEQLLQRMAPHAQQVSGTRIMETASRRLELLALVEQFRALKLEEQSIDYADMMRLSLQLVSARPDVVQRLRSDVRVVLLDEYQDTSVAQRMLMQRAFGDGHPVTAVGDALQAIYEWRGANAVNITQFPEHFPTWRDGIPRRSAVFGLPTTQRFGPRIADLANDITMPLRARMPDVQALEAADAVRNGPGLIDIALHSDERSEFAWLAEQLTAAHASTPWEGMAVLLRQHKHAGAIYEALSSAGIPAQIVGKRGLLAVPDIADLVAYLRVIHDPAANPSWVRILSGPRYRIGVRDLAHLGERGRRLAASVISGGAPGTWQQSLAQAAMGADSVDIVALGDAVADPGDDTPLSSEARERLAELHAEVRGLRRHAGLPVGELVRVVVQRVGLEVELEASERAVERGRRAAVEAFLELAAGFTALDEAQSLTAFLHWLDDGERMGQQAQIEQPIVHGAVSIMTVHAAKGLQFPVVALPALTEGSFPSALSDAAWPTNADALPYALLHTTVDDELLAYPSELPRKKQADAFAEALRPRKLAEELRLAYVAVTRAEQRLIASAARSYAGRVAEPSSLLVQIRDAVSARGGVEHLWAAPAEELLEASTPAPPWPQQLDPGYQERLRSAAFDALAEVEIELTVEERAQVAAWDAAIVARSGERRAERSAHHRVPVPTALTASQAQLLLRDREAFLEALVRPMPRQPALAAKRGSAFHAWLERQFAGQLSLELDDLQADDDDTSLAALQQAFNASEWSRRTPLAVELPFTMGEGVHSIRGRIDAVYRDGEGLIVVDWKTNAQASSDPLQLTIYRHAAAAQFAVPVERVRACFVYVAQGRTEWHAADEDIGAILAGSVLEG
ncbi:MAG: UvrD-helicase domain-containing protein [Candidatus Nanopelagicales bacterium]